MVSIIIVHYRVKNELFACITSIIASNPQTTYEIIVVDNDEVKTIQKELRKTFPKVTYIANKNKGFGHGNNTGAKAAKGEYLFFLNPDTTLYPKTIDSLVNYLNKNRKVTITAPLLYDEDNQLYPQGARELTPQAAIFSFSFIHKLFPNNNMAKSYWMVDTWDKKSIKEVDSIPGTAFVIRKKIFEQIKGFDEKFFMYFEEHDLCKRVKALEGKIVMIPQARVYHALGKSSEQVPGINDIFSKSRFYYFKKHYGLGNSLLAESIMRMSKYSLALLGTLLLSAFLMFYRLSEYMPFIGDQGWFYLSARDMIIEGNVPLVGIASSHPWLHQGAFWTYMLAPVLWFYNFNPISGAYITIFLNLITISLLYIFGSKMFSRRVAIIAALLYATSPLAILQSRMAYHTSPIPLFTLIFLYSLYQLVKGKTTFFPVIIITLATLYNFEIATFLLTVVFLLVLLYGFWKKTFWFRNIWQTRTLLVSLGGFIVIMLPMLLYDLGHGFPQTIKIIVWLGYKVLVLFGYPQLHPEISTEDYKSVITFLADSYRKFVYLPGALVAFTLAVFSSWFLTIRVFSDFKTKRFDSGIVLLTVTLLISIIGIIGAKTISDAYLPIVFSLIPLVLALFFESLIKIRSSSAIFIWMVIGLMAFMNAFTLIEKNYLTTNGIIFIDRINVAKKIVSEAHGRMYNLVGKGVGSQTASFTMNYEYLTWWVGHGPSTSRQLLRFVIEETPRGIILKRYEGNKVVDLK